MRKKHFEQVAKLLTGVSGRQNRKYLADWFADWFAQYNKNFNREKFLQACDIE